MYETIQGLPLFQGTATEQISSFLEKTNVEFVNFGRGVALVEAGEPCACLRFVISGSVRSRMSLAEGRATLCSVSGYGTVLSPCHLFGLHTEWPLDVESVTEGSFMQIRKDQYLELIQTDTVYLVNYLNYLSYHAQRARQALCGLGGKSMESWIGAVRSGLLDRRTVSASIETTRAGLAEVLDMPLSGVETALDDMRLRGEIGLSGDLAITLL